MNILFFIIFTACQNNLFRFFITFIKLRDFFTFLYFPTNLFISSTSKQHSVKNKYIQAIVFNTLILNFNLVGI